MKPLKTAATYLCTAGFLVLFMTWLTPLAASQPASTATPPAWKTRNVGYVVMEQTLKQTLEEIGFQSGVPIQVGRKMDTKVMKKRLEGMLPNVLDEMARDHNLVWFSDGGAIYVERADESTAHVFKIQGARRENIVDALKQFQFINVMDRVQIAPDGSFVRLNGPDSMAKLVETALSTLDKGDSLNIDVIRFGKKFEE